ncbi:hypothetical protein Ahy_A08g039368 isoform F [Arachis hypogaea]|uniref:Uncharacterized protein n=1 Tax=Arachis hypogaea TaxID=3818 RepID=A0A445BWA6_ARAHY|nr:hypothetical protein Ahy_A08g039368 isoform F [Arachis hypogaea]
MKVPKSISKLPSNFQPASEFSFFQNVRDGLWLAPEPILLKRTVDCRASRTVKASAVKGEVASILKFETVRKYNARMFFVWAEYCVVRFGQKRQ